MNQTISMRFGSNETKWNTVDFHGTESGVCTRREMWMMVCATPSWLIFAFWSAQLLKIIAQLGEFMCLSFFVSVAASMAESNRGNFLETLITKVSRQAQIIVKLDDWIYGYLRIIWKQVSQNDDKMISKNFFNRNPTPYENICRYRVMLMRVLPFITLFGKNYVWDINQKTILMLRMEEFDENFEGKMDLTENQKLIKCIKYILDIHLNWQLFSSSKDLNG